MYTQFFGNFLLNKDVISPEELIKAMEKQAAIHLKFGTLAIHEGLLTASEVDHIVITQTHKNKRFGEVAIEEGYLTKEQVDFVLEKQKPSYLLLGQILIEDGKLSNSDFENLISDYQSQYEIFDLESNEEQKNLVVGLITGFGKSEPEPVSQSVIDYLTLFFNNLVRFIGNDFMPLDLVRYEEEYPTNYCISQRISGNIAIQSALDMDTDTAINFASRYANEDFSSFDEYARASLEDFLNLHNGLYSVNMSNERSVELSLTPPEVHSEDILEFETQTYLLSIMFPFGILHFILDFQ